MVEFQVITLLYGNYYTFIIKAFLKQIGPLPSVFPPGCIASESSPGLLTPVLIFQAAITNSHHG
jgi:hypothetical protein